MAIKGSPGMPQPDERVYGFSKLYRFGVGTMIPIVTAHVYAWLFHISVHGWSNNGKARGRLRIILKPVEQVSSISILNLFLISAGYLLFLLPNLNFKSSLSLSSDAGLVWIVFCFFVAPAPAPEAGLFFGFAF